MRIQVILDIFLVVGYVFLLPYVYIAMLLTSQWLRSFISKNSAAGKNAVAPGDEALRTSVPGRHSGAQRGSQRRGDGS